jgi:phosphate uptake regulator
MGQSSLSAVNLIVEDMELKKTNSLQMVENLEMELDDDQKELDSYCFDLLNNYKVTSEQGKKILVYMKTAESLERIGDLCLSISKKFNCIGCSLDGDELINLGQYIKIVMTNSVVFLKENEIDLDELKNDKGIIKKYSEKINSESIEKMKANGDMIPNILDYITITKNFIKIYKLCMTIVENTESFTSRGIYVRNKK